MSMDDSDSFEDCVETQNDIDQVLEELKKWIEDQNKFPKNIPEILLRRFLIVCDGDLKQTQDLMLLNYKLRSSAPNLFSNRDMTTEEMQAASEVMRFFPLPKLTKDKHKVTFGKIHNSDPTKFVYVNVIKMALMMFDTRFCNYDDVNAKEIAKGDILVMDMKGMSFWHFIRMMKYITTAKFYMHYIQEAAPIRIVQVNVVNPSPIVYRIHTLFRPFMKKEILDTMVFHHSFDTLCERLGKELLPEEYGGTCNHDFDKLYENYMKQVKDFHPTLIDDDNWRFSK